MNESVQKQQAQATARQAQELVAARMKILQQMSRVIVGQENVIDQLLIALFSRGHALLLGVPGLAKTLLISSLAQVLDLQFKRIQFTPDLMPSDITGTEILQEDPVTRQRFYQFARGPVFANIVLADEINRASPKTQAALLQAMQEQKVTAGSHTFQLESPFFVLATQNPIEQEGTYALPEAQLDRFMLQIQLTYPAFADEKKIVQQTTAAAPPPLEKVLDATEILALQDVVRQVPAADHVVDYAVRLTRATRPQEPDAFDFIKSGVTWGAGPRGAQALILGAKARALMQSRWAASVEDVQALLTPVLAHRIIPSFQSEADGVTTAELLKKLSEKVQL